MDKRTQVYIYFEHLYWIHWRRPTWTIFYLFLNNSATAGNNVGPSWTRCFLLISIWDSGLPTTVMFGRLHFPAYISDTWHSHGYHMEKNLALVCEDCQIMLSVQHILIYYPVSAGMQNLLQWLCCPNICWPFWKSCLWCRLSLTDRN